MKLNNSLYKKELNKNNKKLNKKNKINLKKIKLKKKWKQNIKMTFQIQIGEKNDIN